MRPYDPSKAVVFMHVPKTAGTSMLHALREALTPRVEFWAFDRSLFGGFAAFETMRPEIRRTIIESPDELPDHAEFVSGHMALSTTKSRYPSAQFITFLREPATRLLSHWVYWRSLSDEQLAPWGAGWAAILRQSRSPLRDFLAAESAACQTDNLAVRMLLWPHPLIPDDDFIDERNDAILVQAARERLKSFSLVDAVENPRLAANMGDWLNRPFQLHRLNETRNVPAPHRTSLSAELDQGTIALLRLRSRLDFALWSMVAGRAIRDFDPVSTQTELLAGSIQRYSHLVS